MDDDAKVFGEQSKGRGITATATLSSPLAKAAGKSFKRQEAHRSHRSFAKAGGRVGQSFAFAPSRRLERSGGGEIPSRD